MKNPTNAIIARTGLLVLFAAHAKRADVLTTLAIRIHFFSAFDFAFLSIKPGPGLPAVVPQRT